MILLSKENVKVFFKYVNCSKSIARKMGALEDIDGKLHFSDEKNVLLNSNFFLNCTVENRQIHSQLSVSRNAAFLATLRCSSNMF